MRSTRIGLQQARRSPPSGHRDDGRPCSSSPWRGCSPSSRAAAAEATRPRTIRSNHPKTSSRGPEAGSRSEAARRSWPSTRKTRKTLSCSGPRSTTIPSHGHPMGASSSFDPIKRSYVYSVSGFVRPSPGRLADHACAPRFPSTSPSFRVRATWGSFSPDGTEVVYGAHRSPDPSSSTRTEASLARSAIGVTSWSTGWLSIPAVRGTDAAAWSPDGSKILWFDFIEGGGRAKPYEDDCPIRECGHRAVLSSINPDGTGRKLGVAPLPGEGASSLVWSPDGSRLAFWLADDADLNAQIFVINADGSSLQQITRDGDNRWPAWSSDGSRIAFVRNGTLFTMTPDGTDMREVRGAMPDGAIAWSPAG